MKSMPSLRDSTEQVAAPGEAESVFLVCSTARRSFASARASRGEDAGATVRGVLVFLVNSFAKNLIVGNEPISYFCAKGALAFASASTLATTH